MGKKSKKKPLLPPKSEPSLPAKVDYPRTLAELLEKMRVPKEK